MVSKHQDLNVYSILLIGGKGPVHIVNCQQLFNLKRSQGNADLLDQVPDLSLLFWLIWSVASSANVIRPHCNCFQCQCLSWHCYCPCTALLVMWLMSVSSYVAYILAIIPINACQAMWVYGIYTIEKIGLHVSYSLFIFCLNICNTF